VRIVAIPVATVKVVDQAAAAIMLPSSKLAGWPTMRRAAANLRSAT
jgi:hypothetical protein